MDYKEITQEQFRFYMIFIDDMDYIDNKEII